mgnify:CR=1 FL=1
MTGARHFFKYFILSDKILCLCSLDLTVDFITDKFILNFFGIENVQTISADQMALDYEKSIKEAEKQIENIV